MRRLAVLILGFFVAIGIGTGFAKQGFTPPELRIAVVGGAVFNGKALEGLDEAFAAVAKELGSRGARVATKTDTKSLAATPITDLYAGKLPDDFTSAIADYVLVLKADVGIAAKNVKGSGKNSYSVDLNIAVVHTDTTEIVNTLKLKGGGIAEAPQKAVESTVKKYTNEIGNYVVSVINNHRNKEFTIKLFVKGLLAGKGRNKFDHRDDLLDLLSYPLRVSEARAISFNPGGKSEFDIVARGLSAGALARIYSKHGYGLVIDKVGRGTIEAHYDPAYGFAVKVYTTAFRNRTRDRSLDAYTETLAANIDEMLKNIPYIWPVVWPEGRPDYPRGRKLRKLLAQIRDEAGPALLLVGELKRTRGGEDQLVLTFYFSLNRKKLLRVVLEGSFDHPEGFAKQLEEKVTLPLLRKLKRYAKKFSSRAKDEIELLEQNLSLSTAPPLPTP